MTHQFDRRMVLAALGLGAVKLLARVGPDLVRAAPDVARAVPPPRVWDDAAGALRAAEDAGGDWAVRLGEGAFDLAPEIPFDALVDGGDDGERP